MRNSITLSIMVAAGFAALACTKPERGPTVTGEFTRYRALMSQGGVTLPELPAEQLGYFPSVVRFDDAHTVQVTGGLVDMQGRYRLERDSIFLDTENKGATRVAFAGRLSNDTLHLHWIPDYDVGDGSTEAKWVLSFARSR